MQNTIFSKSLNLITILLIIIAPIHVLNAQEPSQAPYHYYYSGILNAFVIERADGTDSQILAQNIMPKNHNEITQPLWSPSGRWMAWRSAEYRGAAPSFYAGWIISTDGSRRLTISDHPQDAIVHVSVMEWAVGDDILFVSEVIADENRENAMRHTLLIDAEAEAELASYAFETTFPDDPITFAWLPNNQGVVVLNQSFLQDEGHYLLYLTLLLTDGTVRTETYSAEMSIGLSLGGNLTYISADGEQLVIENLFEEETQVFTSRESIDAQQNLIEFDPLRNTIAEDTEFSLTYPSPSGEYIGLSSSAIFQVNNGETSTFSIHSAATYATSLVHQYNWHPDNLWVITHSNVTFAGCCGANAYTVLRVDSDPNLFRRELTVRWGDSAGWIPQRAIAHLAEGQPESVLQQPSRSYRFADIVSSVIWQPNGDSIIALTNSGDVFIREINSHTQPTSIFNINSNCSLGAFIPSCPMYWDDDSIIIGNQAWDTIQQVLVPAENEDQVECIANGCLSVLSDLVSPNGRWLAHVVSRSLVEIIDQQQGEIIETVAVEDYETITALEWVNDKLLIHGALNIFIISPETRETWLLESTRSQGYTDQFFSMQVSPDKRFVAGGSITSEIHIWEIETGELVTILNWYATDIAFSPDGQWLAASNTDLVTIWDLSAFVNADTHH